MAEVEKGQPGSAGQASPYGESALPRITVYDPAQGWLSLSSRVILPQGIAATLQREGVSGIFNRLEQGSIPDADILLAIVPDRGFDQAQARALDGYPSSALIPRHFR